MPLNLEQYATYLDSRDLPWPVAPPADPPRAKPHLEVLDDVKVVLWTVYGTLLSIFQGELLFEHPTDFVMDNALQKTIDEYKMWPSMSRKPGQPSAYMRELYSRELDQLRMANSGGEKFPEIPCEKIWEGIVKKLFQKEYKFDAGFYGSLDDFARKISWFFHASMQGTGCYPGVVDTLQGLSKKGLRQGLLGDGQHFTMLQLQRAIKGQAPDCSVDKLFPSSLRFLSIDYRAKKPSETLFGSAVESLEKQGIEPHEILHVGTNLVRDIAPAKRFGLKTAFFAGDRNSIQANAEQLRSAPYRPEILFTEFTQLLDVLAPES